MSSEPIFQDLTQELYEPDSVETETHPVIDELNALRVYVDEMFMRIQHAQEAQSNLLLNIHGHATASHVTTTERLDAIVKGVNEIGSMMDWTVKTVSEVATAFQNGSMGKMLGKMMGNGNG